MFGDALSVDDDGNSNAPSLLLYEREGCGECKRVRETLSMLDLACHLRPCPLGATKHRKLLDKALLANGFVLENKNKKLPYLEDASTGAALVGADAIVGYLYDEYLDGSAPSPLVRSGFLANLRAQFAADARGAGDGSGPNPTGALRKGPSGAYYARPSTTPTKPLQLWAYEASPFCSLVRETLSELEIPYVLMPCARGSPRRTALQNRTGTFQVSISQSPHSALIAHTRLTFLFLQSGAVPGGPEHGMRFVRIKRDRAVPTRELPSHAAGGKGVRGVEKRVR